LTGARLSRAVPPRIVRTASAIALSLLAAGACSADGESASARPESPRSDSAAGGITAAGQVGARRAAAPDTSSPVQRRFRAVLAIIGDLREEALLKGRDVRVTGSGTTLVVSGEVPGAAARDRALEIARSRAAGFTVVDSLRIAASSAPNGAP
jgi:hypothetical protein